MKVVQSGGDEAVRDVMHDGLHFCVTGSGPRTVVLLHGFSDNLMTWRRLMPALAVQHRVIAIDLPSHGLSTRRWQRPLLDSYVDAVDEIASACDVAGPLSLVGNSMGGVVAALYAHQNPERTHSVALVGMPGVHGIPRAWRAAASWPAQLALRTVTAPVPMPLLRGAFTGAYARAAVVRSGSIDPAVMRSYRDAYAERERLFDLHPLARVLLRDIARARMDRVVDELTVPALRVWGQYDPLVPARRAPRGRADVAVLRGCGHCPQLEAPEALLSVLLPFLARERVSAASLTGEVEAAPGA